MIGHLFHRAARRGVAALAGRLEPHFSHALADTLHSPAESAEARDSTGAFTGVADCECHPVRKGVHFKVGEGNEVSASPRSAWRFC